jgi:hypothetical protein
MNALLDRIIDEHGLIVCGWSADWDLALRAAITRAPSRRYPVFWAVRGHLSQTAEDLTNHRAGKTIAIDGADPFFEDLERKVSLQADLQRQNPRSIELLVASTKKYLNRPENRIQLDELIGGEIRHVAKTIQDEDFDVGGAWSVERFSKTIARYESLVEPLARIFGVLGRWGTGDDFTLAIETICRFGYREGGSGLVALLALRTYPGVLLFYAYGIALLKARRYNDLYCLFSAEIKTRNQNQTHIVGHLFLGAWEGMSDNQWKSFPGLERHQTPLSDHLHDIFQNWTDHYVFVPDEFTRLFEEFELLAALAFTSLSADLKTLQDAAKGDGSGRNFVWAPVGRVAWDTQNRGALFENLTRPEIATVLLKAGFARRDQAHLTEALGSLKRLFGRIAW